MKRHVQQTGIRQWAAEDFLELQSEPLKAIDSFFEEYGSCVVKGCNITEAGNNNYSISPGLVALEGVGMDGNATFKIVPFSGINGVPLPVYLTLTCSIVERIYIDNKVKPIAYDYRATVSTIKPESSFLEVKKDYIPRFVDVIQNSSHRFFTDVERSKLNKIESEANKYIHPANHPATVITEDAAHRFMTDVERAKLNGIEANANKYIHPANHPATVITEDAAHRFMTDTERTKLNGVEAGANKYIHPANHPATVITEDAAHRFTTDVERAKLNGIEANANKYIHPNEHSAAMVKFTDGKNFQQKLDEGSLRGPQGVQGIKGDTGASGIQGPQGIQGERGYTGIQGVKGDTGAAGSQGLQGPRGERGYTGPAGQQGVKGDVGPQGLPGIQGERGYTGSAGQQGVKGDIGPKGDAGATGAQGKYAELKLIKKDLDPPVRISGSASVPTAIMFDQFVTETNVIIIEYGMNDGVDVFSLLYIPLLNLVFSPFSQRCSIMGEYGNHIIFDELLFMGSYVTGFKAHIGQGPEMDVYNIYALN